MNVVQKLLMPFFRSAGQRQLLYGRRRRALSVFERLCRWADTPENLFNLALAKMNLRDYEGAITLLEPIRKQLPDQVFAGITYGQCLLLARRWADAEAAYQEMADAHPDNKLVRSLSELSRDPVARDKFSASLDLQFQASLRQEEGQYEEALALLQKAAGLTPEDAALFNNLGAVKLKLKYPNREVLADFAQAMRLNSNNDRYQRNYRKAWQSGKK